MRAAPSPRAAFARLDEPVTPTPPIGPPTLRQPPPQSPPGTATPEQPPGRSPER